MIKENPPVVHTGTISTLFSLKFDAFGRFWKKYSLKIIVLFCKLLYKLLRRFKEIFRYRILSYVPDLVGLLSHEYATHLASRITVFCVSSQRAEITSQ